MKSRIWLVLLFAMLFGTLMSITPMLSHPAMAADEWAEEEGEEEDAFGNIMKTTFATIDKVDFAAPAANAPCAVTAKITFNDEEGESKITSVKLVYYVNGDLAKGNEVAMAGDAGSYSGSIPGQAAGSKIDFIIRVEDSNGNVTSNAVSSAKATVSAIADMDNSADIVGDDADILGLSAGYDADNLYVDFNVQGKINGGTVDPPYIQLYGIKVTNPDQEQGEGLMVGKLWIYLPLAKEKAVQDKFMPMIMDQGAEYVQKMGKEKIDNVMKTGMLVLNIQKLMGGNIMEGLLFDADPTATTDGGNLAGVAKIKAFGDNPSGYLRIIILTAANASLDSFMPIPLNCSHFLTLYRNAYAYDVK